MSRPTYETAADLSKERRIADALTAKWQCSVVKLPIKYSLDFAMVRDGRVKAWLEVRDRTYSMARIGELGGYMIALHKLQHARSLSETSGAPFALAVSCPEGVWVHIMHEFPRRTVTIGGGGRGGRNDWQDIEPIVMIPVDQFGLQLEPISEAAA